MTTASACGSSAAVRKKCTCFPRREVTTGPSCLHGPGVGGGGTGFAACPRANAASIGAIAGQITSDSDGHDVDDKGDDRRKCLCSKVSGLVCGRVEISVHAQEDEGDRGASQSLAEKLLRPSVFSCGMFADLRQRKTAAAVSRPTATASVRS
jgi:hypothetical protein